MEKKDGTTEVSIEDLIQNKVLVRVTDNGVKASRKNIFLACFERFFQSR